MGIQSQRRGVRLVVCAVAGFVTAATQAGEGDAARGKAVFAPCLYCHSPDPGVHKDGPSLASIWGRRAGTVEGFGDYSTALKSSDVVWTAESLDRWLQGPRSLIPDTTMVEIRLGDPTDRRDLIEYMKGLESAAK